MNPNGGTDGESRLDRVERILAESVIHNQRAHEEFEREFRGLLTAQVLSQDHMDRVERNLAEATDKLNALIELMARHLREPHERQ